jgi:hypothetical protein
MIYGNRDDFSKKTIDAISKRASFICSNPQCKCLTLCPSEEDQKKHIGIGKVAHITAAAKKGPRYDSSLSREQRCSIENGIFLCSTCADMVDKNSGADFPATMLREWKENHEIWVKTNLNKSLNALAHDFANPIIIGGRATLPIKSASANYRYPHGFVILSNSGGRVCYLEDLKILWQGGINFEINIISFDEERIKGQDPKGIELIPIRPFEKQKIYFKAKEVEQYKGELPKELILEVKFDCSKKTFSGTLTKDGDRPVYLSAKS